MKLILLSILLTASGGLRAAQKPAVMVDEGAFFEGIEGLLKKEADTDSWQFVPNEPIEITDKVTIPAETALQILPSSVLEQMTGLAGDENRLRIELSALFTRYKNHNYLFSVFFVPIQDEAQEKTTPPSESKEAKGMETPAEEDTIIPSDILKQIKASKTPDLQKFQQIAEVTGDVHLIGRAGFLSKTNGSYRFSPDAFGRKIDSKQFILLANSMLARAERQMAREPGRERYNVSGLVTMYKGKTYMLLRRANRTYTHGNFTN